VKKDCFQVVDPPAPVRERMERDNITPQHLQLLKDWTTHMLEVTGKDDVTIAEPNPSAAGSDYARTLDATARRAQPRDPDRGIDR
jgi:hypothetical protein